MAEKKIKAKTKENNKEWETWLGKYRREKSRRIEWTDEEFVEDKAYKNVQELKILEVATGSILTANWYEAHLDG